MWMHLQAFFLHKQGNRKLFYGSVSDVSTTMSLQKELLAILQTMPGDIFEYQVYPDERLSCRVISAGLSLLHGYTTQELQDILENGMLEYIDERDHDEVMRIWSNPKQWKRIAAWNSGCLQKTVKPYGWNSISAISAKRRVCAFITAC